jgi:membrane protein DedA with SNARE-associated domain
MHDLLTSLIDWYISALSSGGYPLIVLLMFIESTVFPLPSELVIPPAAYLAHTTGVMSPFGVILAGAVGSWLGASAMYWLSRWVGRAVVLRWGKYVLVTPEKLEKAERWSAVYGDYSIFASRMLPVVRHLVGIPAGIVRMSYLGFSVSTLIGSAIWVAILYYLGVKAGQDTALMQGELQAITIWAVGILAVLGVLYWLFVHRHMKKIVSSDVPPTI